MTVGTGDTGTSLIALSGDSICSAPREVWHIGDLNVPIERWKDHPPKLVAVEICAYRPLGSDPCVSLGDRHDIDSSGLSGITPFD